jgi:hypothetical protein
MSFLSPVKILYLEPSLPGTMPLNALKGTVMVTLVCKLKFVAVSFENRNRLFSSKSQALYLHL